MSQTTRSDPVDEMFAEPYVDVDEWRDSPVRHRYVHGGFAGTETRFSIYLPPADLYRGRFFQHITPVPDSENLAQHVSGEQDKIGFSIASGGYFLETNGGGASGGPGSSVDPTIAAYRANAAAARVLTRGGGRRCTASIGPTATPMGGAVAATAPSAAPRTPPASGTVSSPMSSVPRWRSRTCSPFACTPCGSCVTGSTESSTRSSPAEAATCSRDLDDEERDALVEVTRMGFPPRSWFGHRTMGMHAFPVLYQGMVMADPTYFEEFWTQPGYLGYELPPSLRRDRVQLVVRSSATITEDEAVALGLSATGR